jgi:hypothetical protein
MEEIIAAEATIVKAALVKAALRSTYSLTSGAG